LEPLVEKLEFTKKEKNIVMNAKKLLQLNAIETDFDIYKAFEEMDIETLLILAVLDDQKCAGKVFRYLDYLREIKLSVSGKDLLEIGIAPSKIFAEAFDYLLNAKLKNPQLTKEEEKKLLVEYIKSITL